MSSLERVESNTPLVQQSESAAIFSMIERAARDPGVDLDKMERLMKMRRDADADAKEAAFWLAMRAAQADMGVIGADATNSQTRSKYATYAKLDSVLRPIYTKHGFSLSFDEGESPKPEHVRILCYVSNAGHTKTYHKDMPADGKGAKGGDVMTKTHATGAAASYGARYLLKGIFNVAVGEEDADGNAPASGETVSSEQIRELLDLVQTKSANMEAFLKYYRIERLPDLPASRFPDARALLVRKGG